MHAPQGRICLYAGTAAAMDTNHDTSVVGEADGVAESPTEGQHVLKFEVQIYKARDGEYVVDFQVKVT